jgi:hypothetical protein
MIQKSTTKGLFGKDPDMQATIKMPAELAIKNAAMLLSLNYQLREKMARH